MSQKDEEYRLTGRFERFEELPGEILKLLETWLGRMSTGKRLLALTGMVVAGWLLVMIFPMPAAFIFLCIFGLPFSIFFFKL